MKEVWVKKTIWRRYLVDEYDIDNAEQTLMHDDNGDKILADCYDLNEKLEYDLEEVINPVEFEIKNITPV
jgi:hypothetical protein